MKKIVTIFVMLLLGALSTAALAGRVDIYPYIGDGSLLTINANYNVRFAPDPGHENSYVSMTVNSAGYITVYGYDAVSLRSFYCRQVGSASATERLRDHVTQLHTNGTQIWTSQLTGNYCDDFEITHDSRIQ